MGKLQGIIAKIKSVKHIEIYVAVAAVAIMLLVYFAGSFGGTFGCSSGIGGSSGSGGTGSAKATQTVSYGEYCSRMQQEVTEYVGKIKGAGKAKAVINWESSVELIIAATENNSTSSTSTSPIVISGSGVVVLKEIYPKAIGVVVVCEGGGDAAVKVNIILSVSTLLDISTEKIIVLPMS